MADKPPVRIRHSASGRLMTVSAAAAEREYLENGWELVAQVKPPDPVPVEAKAERAEAKTTKPKTRKRSSG